jgi:acyl-CoA synthetase (NDP forming)
VEVIVGVVQDPVFGPCVMFGLGGVFVETLQDVSFRVAPLTAHDAEEMIQEIKAFRVLQGVRGKPASDVKALTDIILKVSRLAVEFTDEIAELDINPLIIFPHGVCVADAMIVKKAIPPSGSREVLGEHPWPDLSR